MAWVTVVEQDVLDRYSQDELDAIEAAGDTRAALDVKLTGIIAQVTGLVQGYIGSCNRNTPFGAAGTVPQSFLYHTVSLIRHALGASLPNLAQLNGELREAEYEDAKTFFNKVAMCDIATPPDSGDLTTVNASPILYDSETKLSFANT